MQDGNVAITAAVAVIKSRLSRWPFTLPCLRSLFLLPTAVHAGPGLPASFGLSYSIGLGDTFFLKAPLMSSCPAL